MKKLLDKYMYNMLADSLSRKLLRIKNEQNQFVIDRIIKELDYDKNYTKPKVDWGRVHSVCETCPFGDSPPDLLFLPRIYGSTYGNGRNSAND